MKNTNVAKKQTSQLSSNGISVKNANTHIKIAKPRPNGSETSHQGPRDCFPLG